MKLLNTFVAVVLLLYAQGSLDPAKLQPLWHANLAAPLSNGPMTYELDGQQYLVVAAGDTLYGFMMLNKRPIE